MLEKCDKYIMSFAYAYLLIPFALFSIGWMKWFIGIPCAVAAVFAFIKTVRENNEKSTAIAINKKTVYKIVAIVLLIILWVTLSGIGRVVYQNYDHCCRNPIYEILVKNSWPCVNANGTRGITYYVGFWMLPALVGKVFGVQAGYIFQMIWAAVGILLFYYLICRIRGKISVWPLIVIMFFSGLDWVGSYINADPYMDLSYPYHIEWWATYFQFSSNTTQLFWVFNQAIPIWIAIALILQQVNVRNVYFIISLCIISSTIPFVGATLLAVAFTLKEFIRLNKEKKGILSNLVCLIRDQVLSIQNLIGVFVIGIVCVLFLFGNEASGSLMFYLKPGEGENYLTFLLLEVGVYLVFTWKKFHKNPMYITCLVIFIFAPLIYIGAERDFCMRVSIPALMFLNIACIQVIDSYIKEKKIIRLVAMMLIMLIGAITPTNEIRRTVKNTYIKATTGEDLAVPDRDYDFIFEQANFAADTDTSLFYKYLGK